jgi:hypothetical protein
LDTIISFHVDDLQADDRRRGAAETVDLPVVGTAEYFEDDRVLVLPGKLIPANEYAFARAAADECTLE